jgi:hypothetical protein
MAEVFLWFSVMHTLNVLRYCSLGQYYRRKHERVVSPQRGFGGYAVGKQLPDTSGDAGDGGVTPPCLSHGKRSKAGYPGYRLGRCLALCGWAGDSPHLQDDPCSPCRAKHHLADHLGHGAPATKLTDN